MKILARDIDPVGAYKLLSGAVVPRPIAWVTTLSEVGVVNLAPFSCFTFLSSDPPTLGFLVGPRRGDLKDTARNIRFLPQFVVHIADVPLLEALHASADEFLPEESEAEKLNLKLLPSEYVQVPRIAVAPVALECVHDQTVKVGRVGTEFIIGEVKVFHVRDELYVDGKIDSAALSPIARLAGPTYCALGEIVRMRPNKTSAPGVVSI